MILSFLVYALICEVPQLEDHLDHFVVGQIYSVNIIDTLRPTQFSYGRKEVEYRAKKMKRMSRAELQHYKERKVGEVIIGPKNKVYLIDGHHMAAALDRIGKKRMLVRVKTSLRSLNKKKFVRRMVNKPWVWLYNHKGEKVRFVDLPRSIRDLEDDPYRSLAWLVEDRGGFDDVKVPFAEFMWARFYRSKLEEKRVKSLSERVIFDAIELSHSFEARHLPGYKGECDDSLREIIDSGQH